MFGQHLVPAHGRTSAFTRMIAALAATVLAFAAADPAPTERAGSAGQMLEGVTACRALTDPAARLSCFDAAAERLAAAVKTKEVTVVDREDMRRTKRSLFGFSLPRIPLFQGDDEPAAKEIVAKVLQVRDLGYGKYELRIESGATWQTTEAEDTVEPSRGDTVRIRIGALGNYFLRFNDAGRAVRGRRVQ